MAMYWIRGRHGDITPARSTYSPFVNLLKRKMSKFQFPTFSSMHCKTGKVRVSCLEFDSVPLGSCCVAGGVGGGWGSYSGLSSVVFIQDVEGDLLGETPQQTRRVQVPLEAEQPVDTSFRSGAAIRGPTPEPCCAGRRGGAELDMTSLKVRGLLLLLSGDYATSVGIQQGGAQTAERSVRGCNLHASSSGALLLSRNINRFRT